MITVCRAKRAITPEVLIAVYRSPWLLLDPPRAERQADCGMSCGCCGDLYSPVHGWISPAFRGCKDGCGTSLGRGEGADML